MTSIPDARHALPPRNPPLPHSPGDPALQPVQVMTLSNQDVCTEAHHLGWHFELLALSVHHIHIRQGLSSLAENTRSNFKTANLKLDQLTPGICSDGKK